MWRMYNQIRRVEIIYSQEDNKEKIYIIDYRELDINFNIRFTNDKTNNLCEIMLYNLKQDTLINIKEHAKIRLIAGYEDFNGVIFNGEIDYITTTRDGNNLMTKLYCTPGAYTWNTAFISQSWGIGAKGQDIANQIISMAGFKPGIVKIENLVYNGGKTFRGTAQSCLQQIANDAGAMLYYDNGTVYLHPKGEKVKKAIVVSPGQGLIEIPTQNKRREKKKEKSKTNKSGTKKKKPNPMDIAIGKSTYNIKTALRYDYTEDTILIVKGSQFIEETELKILRGTHVASDSEFYTKLECIKISDINSKEPKTTS